MRKSIVDYIEEEIFEIDQHQVKVGDIYYRVLLDTCRLQEIRITRCSKYNTSFEVMINGISVRTSYGIHELQKYCYKDKQVALRKQLERINLNLTVLQGYKQQIERELDPSKKIVDKRNDEFWG